MFRPVLFAVLLFPFSMALAAGAPADDRILLSGAGVSVSAQDLKYELQLLDEARREKVLASPDELKTLAANIYLRRRMERIAYEKGLMDDVLFQARLRMERERVFTQVIPRRIALERDLSDEDAETSARAYYEENIADFTPPERIRAAHILLKAPNDKEKERRRPEAEALLARLNEGEDFGELAAEHSEDGSRMMKGDLGTFERGKMVPEFEEAAFALQNPGDGTGVVETRFGLHIIQLLERPSTDPMEFDSVKDRIIDRVRREHRERVLAQWLEEEAAPRPEVVDEAGMQALADAMRGEAAGEE